MRGRKRSWTKMAKVPQETRPRRKPVVQETSQPTPQRSHIWNFQEKKALLEALKKHGFSDTALLAREVGTRNQNEVEYFINVWSRRRAKREDFGDVNISRLFHPPVGSKPLNPEVFPPIALWKKIIMSVMQGKNRRDDYSYIYSELFKKFAEEEPECDDPDMPNFKQVYKFFSDLLNDTTPARTSPLNSLFILHLIDDMRKFLSANDLEEEFTFARAFYGPMRLLPLFKNEGTKMAEMMSECNAYGVPTLPICITHEGDEEVENKKCNSQGAPLEASTHQVLLGQASLPEVPPSASEASTSRSQLCLVATSERESSHESTSLEVLPQAPTTRKKSRLASTSQRESNQASSSLDSLPPASEEDSPQAPATRGKSSQASASQETLSSVSDEAYSQAPATRRKLRRASSSYQRESNQALSASVNASSQAPASQSKLQQSSAILEKPPYASEEVSSVPATSSNPQQATTFQRECSWASSSLEPQPLSPEEAPIIRRKPRRSSISQKKSNQVSTSQETLDLQTSGCLGSSDIKEEISCKEEFNGEDIWSSMLSMPLSVFKSISDHLKIKENLNPLMTHIFLHKKEQVLVKEYINAYREPDE